MSNSSVVHAISMKDEITDDQHKSIRNPNHSHNSNSSSSSSSRRKQDQQKKMQQTYEWRPMRISFNPQSATPSKESKKPPISMDILAPPIERFHPSTINQLDSDGLVSYHKKVKSEQTISISRSSSSGSNSSSNATPSTSMRRLVLHHQHPHHKTITAVASNYSKAVVTNKSSTMKSVSSASSASSASISGVKTGLVYDARMFSHKNIFVYDSDDDDEHPENPDRMTAIYDQLREQNLLEKCIRIPARLATEKEIQLFHEPEHYTRIEQLRGQSLKELEAFADESDSLYFNNETPFCARLSCGGSIELCCAIATGKVNNGIAIVRPPGHHAEKDQSMGFCIYNNVVVAVKRLRELKLANRNGTQEAFYDDPNVLFVSIHRYEEGVFYPGSEDGFYDYVGEGAGQGKNINIPWEEPNMTNSDYNVLPVGKEFNPDLVVVSAGFDASEGDPIGDCKVSPGGFGWMTSKLMAHLANGRLALILEGGYNLEMVARCAEACVHALLKTKSFPRPNGRFSPAAYKDVMNVVIAHKPYWRCLSEVNFSEFTDTNYTGFKRRRSGPTSKMQSTHMSRAAQEETDTDTEEDTEETEETEEEQESSRPTSSPHTLSSNSTTNSSHSTSITSSPSSSSSLASSDMNIDTFIQTKLCLIPTQASNEPVDTPMTLVKTENKPDVISTAQQQQQPKGRKKRKKDAASTTLSQGISPIVSTNTLHKYTTIPRLILPRSSSVIHSLAGTNNTSSNSNNTSNNSTNTTNYSFISKP
ncbi:hypothetical protein BDF22DRAFT_700847 [Syncephalis plumigaleata]|nr:hypothetical protein BDF22DRAFT_700847 [Syncephalis plumigaleata]